MNKRLNAAQVLENINKAIAELGAVQGISSFPNPDRRMVWKGYSSNDKVFKMRAVCDELSIFDWWKDTLSMSQLKQMKSFVETAIKLGFTSYVCFLVGAKGFSHGMWAYTKERLNYSSYTGDILFHSFRSCDNYWDAKLNGEWLHEKYSTKENDCPHFTLKQIKEALSINK